MHFQTLRRSLGILRPRDEDGPRNQNRITALMGCEDQRAPDRDGQRVAGQLHHRQRYRVPNRLVDRDERWGTHRELERPRADDARLLESRQLLGTNKNLETFRRGSFCFLVVFRSCNCDQEESRPIRAFLVPV